MHTQVKILDIDSEKLISDYVARRLTFSLSRFGERIGKVTARIGMASSGGPQNLICRITAEFRPFGLVAAEAIDSDVYAAIERSASRLERQCQSKSARRRSGSNRDSIRVPVEKSAA